MRATCAGSIERFFEPMHTTARAERVSHLNVQGYIACAATVPEGWPSGLRRTLGKRVYGKPYRGFESHSLRHLDVRRRSLTFTNLQNRPIYRPLLALQVHSRSPQSASWL